MATCSEDGKLVLWDASSGQVRLARELRGASAVAWSTTGDTLALGEHLSPSRASEEDELPEYSTFGLEELLEEDSALAEFEASARSVRESVVPFYDPVKHPQINLLDTTSGEQIGVLESSRVKGSPRSLVWSADGALFSAMARGLTSWDTRSGHFLGFLEESAGYQFQAIALSPTGSTLAAAAGADSEPALMLWDVTSGRLRAALEDTDEGTCIDWSPRFSRIAIGHASGVVVVWDAIGDDFEQRILEGHTAQIDAVSFSHDGRLLATFSEDGTIKLWDTAAWTLISERRIDTGPPSSVIGAFSPTSNSIAAITDFGTTVRLWSIDMATIRARRPPAATAHYANAKVVLLGDLSVGKTGLGLVLSRQDFRPTDSTHRRNIWTFSTEQQDGASPERREVYLWDLAGQPGYRLLHQLHLADVAVALIVFDARGEIEPLSGVKYWSRALTQAERQAGAPKPRIARILVAARTDRGGAMVSDDELRSVRQQFGLESYITTSAKEGQGITALREQIAAAIDWEALPKVSSTGLFEAIRAFLQEKSESAVVLATEAELRDSFSRTGAASPTDIEGEFRTCIDRAQARGLVRRLSFGNLILLKPELLDSYAAAALHAAGSSSDGLGAIEEARVRNGDFAIPTDDRLPDEQGERLLLIATIEDLIRHEVALREESSHGTYLVFPTQTKRSLPDLTKLRPWGRFKFEGAVQHVWATLVVRLTHSGVFSQDGVGADAAQFTAFDHTLGLKLAMLEEGQAELRLLADGAPSDGDELLRRFVAEHLKKRALRGSAQFMVVVACPSCGFVAPDALLDAVGAVASFNCPMCPADIRVDASTDLEPESSASPETVDTLEAAADRERVRLAARIAVQGKEEVREFDAFLAHNSHDKRAVMALAERMRDLGLNPWFDRDEIIPGRWFQDVLQDAVTRVRSAVIVVGEHGLGRWQALELKMFVSQCIESEVPVIPTLLPGAEIPPSARFLRELQDVEFLDSIDETEPFAKLVWGITADRRLYDELRSQPSPVLPVDGAVLVQRAVNRLVSRVRVIATSKLTISVEVTTRTGVDRFGVSLPEGRISARDLGEPSVRIELRRSTLTRLAHRGTLEAYRAAAIDADIRITGPTELLARLGQAVDDQIAEDERRRQLHTLDEDNSDVSLDDEESFDDGRDGPAS